MKWVLVCGARDYPHYRVIESALRGERGEIGLVIEGGASGADTQARSACKVLGIPFEEIKAPWATHGVAAGPVRNGWMLSRLREWEGEKEVWAFHRELAKSKGTANMVKRAQLVGVPVRLYSGLANEWTTPPFSVSIEKCRYCGGEKLLPALLAFKVRCEADFHTGLVQRSRTSVLQTGNEGSIPSLSTKFDVT